MTTDDKPMPAAPNDISADEPVEQSRRQFLVSLGKWSKAVIAGAVLGGLAYPERDAQARVIVGPGGGWINRRGGYGGGWINGGGGWVNGWGGGWVNGGGGGWINRRGGGGWLNRR